VAICSRICSVCQGLPGVLFGLVELAGQSQVSGQIVVAGGDVCGLAELLQQRQHFAVLGDGLVEQPAAAFRIVGRLGLKGQQVRPVAACRGLA
jgi:hypothetical protein